MKIAVIAVYIYVPLHVSWVCWVSHCLLGVHKTQSYDHH